MRLWLTTALFVFVQGCYLRTIQERRDPENLDLDGTNNGGGDSPLLAQATPSPNASRRVTVTGQTRPGEPIGLFFSLDCSGDAVALGTAADDGTFALEADVAANTITPLSVTDGVKCAQLGNYVHDDVPPSATLTLLPGPAGTALDVTLAVATEAGAFIDLFATADCTGSPLPATGAQVTANTSQPFSARVRDFAQNEVCVATSYIHDDIAPIVSAPQLTGDSQNVVDVGWSATDSGSGVVTSRVCVSEAPEACTAPVDPAAVAVEVPAQATELSSQPENTRLYVSVEARDAAGNTGTSPLASLRTLTTRHNVAQLALGEAHACARMGDGTVQCWGNGRYGRLGNGNTAEIISSTPYTVTVTGGEPLTRIVDLCVGAAHSCALQANDDVYCWGSNSVGQLGVDPSTTGSASGVAIASGVGGTRRLACASSSTCAVRTTGSVNCWGDDGSRQLGRGVATPTGERHVPANVLVSAGVALSRVVEVDGGDSHYCAVRDDGGVYCWGANLSGQLGRNTFTANESFAAAVLSAAPSTALAEATDVSVGYSHSCATRADGTLACWGENSSLQLGGTTTPTDVALATASPSGASSIVAFDLGGQTSCYVGAWGQAHCWGSDFFRQNANADSDGTSTHIARVQQQLPAGTPIEDVASIQVSLTNVCVLLADGDVLCWGNNDTTKVVSDAGFTQTSEATVRTFLPTRLGARQVSLGAEHACAVMFDGNAYCWGDNGSLQLGVPAPAFSEIPRRVQGYTRPIRAVAAGNAHSCVLLGSGLLGCFGSNDFGQLGTGVIGTDAAPGGITLSGGIGLRHKGLAAGGDNTCALRANLGRVLCWGKGADGALGNGSVADAVTPAFVNTQAAAALEDVTQIAVGPSHACAVTVNGRATCWGKNTESQLGRATNASLADITTNTMLPPDASPAAFATHVDAGRAHTCISRSDGEVHCLGLNDNAQFGNDAQSAIPTTTLSAVQALGAPLKNAIGVSIGRDSTCAVRRNNTPVRCWGQNDRHQNANDFGALNLSALQYLSAGIELAGVVEIDQGDAFSCAVVSSGDIHCAGANDKGQTGQPPGADVTNALVCPHLP